MTKQTALAFVIFSTLATDNRYTNYEAGGADVPLALGDGVLIQGGAGVANDRLITPAGVATRVTAEELEYLQQNEVFKLHSKNGFLKVESGEGRDVDAAASDMSAADPGRQLVEADFTDGNDGEPKPSVGGAQAKPAAGKSRTGR